MEASPVGQHGLHALLCVVVEHKAEIDYVTVQLHQMEVTIALEHGQRLKIVTQCLAVSVFQDSGRNLTILSSVDSYSWRIFKLVPVDNLLQCLW